MDERIIVKSEQYNTAKIMITTWVLGLISSIITFFVVMNDDRSWWADRRPYDEEYSTLGKFLRYRVGEGLDKYDFDESLLVFFCFFIVGLFIYWWLSKNEIFITNKRVYGKSVFGKRVDLPIDSVSAIGSKWPKGVAVATSSGKVAFLMIKNRDEIHKCVSNLLIERQSKPTTTTPIKQEVPQSNADELKKYKELLDSGIITQEEFDAKKKQLLRL